MTDTMEPTAPPEHDPLSPDPAAPYGRTDDGVLLDRNGKRAPYGLTKSGNRKDHPPQRVRSKASKQASRPSGRTITTKRRQGLLQLADLPKGLLLGLGFKADSDAMLADAVTIDMHAPTMADAISQIAEDNDRLAAVVDRLIDVGPMAIIGMALGAFAAQIARNHEAIPAPVATMLGAAHDPAELAQIARGSVEAMGAGANGTQPAAA